MAIDFDNARTWKESSTYEPNVPAVNAARAEAALAAGAVFIVTPNVELDVIRMARSHGIPVMPGALTPTEIWTAVKAGADFVKVFPASAVGPGYFRELRGPFESIPFMASGGVSLENAAEFIKFGVDALGLWKMGTVLTVWANIPRLSVDPFVLDSRSFAPFRFGARPCEEAFHAASRQVFLDAVSNYIRKPTRPEWIAHRDFTPSNQSPTTRC